MLCQLLLQELCADRSNPEGVQHRGGQPLTYDLSVITENGVTISSGEFGGAVHRVMARGDRREEIFRDDRDRWKFLGYLAEGAERYRVKVYCYVLMENHFHPVVMTPEGTLM